jgi:hypothetical protein
VLGKAQQSVRLHSAQLSSSVRWLKKKMNELLQKFTWALQALAQPADVQIQLYPNFVCVADELALEYNVFLVAVLVNHSQQFSSTQVQTLQSLDAFLNQMSGSENKSHWTNDALRNDGKWAQVRILAEEALNELGWTKSVPPISPKERGAVYQQGK